MKSEHSEVGITYSAFKQRKGWSQKSEKKKKSLSVCSPLSVFGVGCHNYCSEINPIVYCHLYWALTTVDWSINQWCADECRRVRWESCEAWWADCSQVRGDNEELRNRWEAPTGQKNVSLMSWFVAGNVHSTHFYWSILQTFNRIWQEKSAIQYFHFNTILLNLFLKFCVLKYFFLLCWQGL